MKESAHVRVVSIKNSPSLLFLAILPAFCSNGLQSNVDVMFLQGNDLLTSNYSTVWILHYPNENIDFLSLNIWILIEISYNNSSLKSYRYFYLPILNKLCFATFTIYGNVWFRFSIFSYGFTTLETCDESLLMVLSTGTFLFKLGSIGFQALGVLGLQEHVTLIWTFIEKCNP